MEDWALSAVAESVCSQRNRFDQHSNWIDRNLAGCLEIHRECHSQAVEAVDWDKQQRKHVTTQVFLWRVIHFASFRGFPALKGLPNVRQITTDWIICPGSNSVVDC